MTSDNIAINSANFQVDKNGNMSCNKATITGGSISLKDISGVGNEFNITSNNGQDRTWIGSSMFSMGKSNIYDNSGIFMTTSETSEPTLNISNILDQITTIAGSGIITPTLTQTSKESLKKNIEKYKENAMEIVKNSQIYSYNFKSENDTDKKHIGFVIGDEGGEYKTPEEVISADKEGINSYNMISILWKAVQEQQEIIENLEKEIKEMKGEKINE